MKTSKRSALLTPETAARSPSKGLRARRQRDCQLYKILGREHIQIRKADQTLPQGYDNEILPRYLLSALVHDGRHLVAIARSCRTFRPNVFWYKTLWKFHPQGRRHEIPAGPRDP